MITSRELGVPKAVGDGEVQWGRGVRQFRYYSVGEVLYLWTLSERRGEQGASGVASVVGVASGTEWCYSGSWRYIHRRFRPECQQVRRSPERVSAQGVAAEVVLLGLKPKPPMFALEEEEWWGQKLTSGVKSF